MTTNPADMASSKTRNYNFALQQYRLLLEQHQELCTHLDQIRPRLFPSDGIASLPYSPSASPTRSSSTSSTASSSSQICAQQRTGDASRNQRRQRQHMPQHDTLDTIPDEDTLDEILTEEQRLVAVNESIKRALTEMLNCDAVRRDMTMRMWVQTRLMETEKELRSERRRRSSGSVE